MSGRLTRVLYVQLFLDHLPIRKGKEDKKKRAVVKGKDGKFRSASAAAVGSGPNTAPPSTVASGAPSGHNSPATPNPTTPNAQTYHLSQSSLGLGIDGVGELSTSEGADVVMHDMPLHERPLLDDPMHDVIDVT